MSKRATLEEALKNVRHAYRLLTQLEPPNADVVSSTRMRSRRLLAMVDDDLAEATRRLGDRDCEACQKVWAHHSRGEAGTVCATHYYGPAGAPDLAAPGGD
jgi:hypothetical protein